jgi:hypothetical protein
VPFQVMLQETQGPMSRYWRMQLHPARPRESIRYCVTSLAAGFIGLDFAGGDQDLRQINKKNLPEGQRDFMDFAKRMNKGDKVLIVAHNLPFALATVSGDYNHIAQPEEELGIWFRHFRRVKNVRYYADYRTNVRTWDRVIMPDTLSILGRKTQTYRIMKQWERDG